MSDLRANLTLAQHCQGIEAFWAQQQEASASAAAVEGVSDNGRVFKALLSCEEIFTYLDRKSIFALQSVVKLNSQEDAVFYKHLDQKSQLVVWSKLVVSLSEGDDILSRNFIFPPKSCTVSAFKTLLQKNAEIKSLHLWSCKDFTKVVIALEDDELHRLFVNCEELSLNGTDISAWALKKLLPHLTNVKRLDLSGCHAISRVVFSCTDDELRDLFGNFIELDLTNARISADFLKRLLPWLTKVETLDLTYNSAGCITDLFRLLSHNDLEAVFEKCKYLHCAGMKIPDELLERLSLYTNVLKTRGKITYVRPNKSKG